MRRQLQRKSAPGVRRGRVQKKNNWAPTPDYGVTPQSRPFIDRQRPGAGYRHLLLKRDVQRFVELLPDWPTLSQGLNGIVLAPGSRRLLGYQHSGIVALCAWDRDVERTWDGGFVAEHRYVLALLGVPTIPLGGARILCRFTESTARAFQLLHVLLHELGHHHDQMATRARHSSCRGESFAEQYALGQSLEIYDRYLREFGL